MTDVQLVIDGRPIAVPAGRTVLEAARELGIRIPTLCHLDGFGLFTSCMVCVVRDAASKQLLPACSAPAAEGMRIETETEAVRDARRDALEFLLSEHIGDCDAPCRRACPAGMDIPKMIREIRAGRLVEAIATVKKDIALPAVLGRICPAPCEKACHRGDGDDAVSICALKRFAADADLARKPPSRPSVRPASGKKVAVVGAGPAGLSAAYYLLRDGHACHVFDRNSDPGGMLRYGVLSEDLPAAVLDAEIGRIAELGAEFRMNRSLGRDLALEELQGKYDAVVLATGEMEPGLFDKTGVALSARGVAVGRQTFETSVSGLFAAGNVISPARLTVRAGGHGKDAAFSVGRFLESGTASGPRRRFQSIMGKLRDGEAEEFLQEAEASKRRPSPKGTDIGFSETEAGMESGRCYGCDCRKPDSCRLRRYAEEYEAAGRRYVFAERKKFEKIIRHDEVVYEPGKCIKCGLCVRITEKAGEELGLTFVGRGFEVRVEAPFGEPFGRGLLKAAGECIAACPTGALAWRDRNRK